MIIRYLKIILCFIIIGNGLSSCKNKAAHERIVTVSILPQKYLTERIAGDFVKVNVMIPPGMNPATCDLNTGQLKQLYNSDICFTIGYLPFEITHLYPVLENLEQIEVINHSGKVELLDGSCGHQHEQEHSHAGGKDPHIWLSPANAKIMANTICEVLSSRYPGQQEQFRANLKTLSSELDSIALRAEEVLTQLQNKSFLIYHPALTYIAHDYGLEQISIEDEGKEPHPLHLKKIIDIAKEKNIRIIFIQSQFDASNAEAIAMEIGAQVISIDPLTPNLTEELNKLIDIFGQTRDSSLLSIKQK